MTDINSDLIEEIAEALLGTCESLGEELEQRGLELTDIPEDLLGELDSKVLRCETCEWWVETHEVDDEGNCDDCQ